MKYCISGRQPKSILAKVDEIKMEYRDIDKIFDYMKEFPDKTFIIEIPKDQNNIDWSLINNFNQSINLILALQNLNLAKYCVDSNIKFYWAYPISTWYELDSIIKLNPCYLFLTAPLSFDLNKVNKKSNIPIRLCPNLAHDLYMPRENGIFGPWVRPEDTDLYSQWVETFEFVADELSKEEILLHVYKDNKNWPGNLNFLLTNFNYDVDNRAIAEDFGEKRANCGQHCMEKNNCRWCENNIIFANHVKKLAKEKKKIIPIE